MMYKAIPGVSGYRLRSDDTVWYLKACKEQYYRGHTSRILTQLKPRKRDGMFQLATGKKVNKNLYLTLAQIKERVASAPTLKPRPQMGKFKVGILVGDIASSYRKTHGE